MILVKNSIFWKHFSCTLSQILERDSPALASQDSFNSYFFRHGYMALEMIRPIQLWMAADTPKIR